MTAYLRDLYRRLVRRVMLARGVRACHVRYRIYGSRWAGIRGDVIGRAAWWASPEDVAAELRRAWRSARRQFARRHGIRLRLPAVKFVRDEPNQTWQGKELA